VFTLGEIGRIDDDGYVYLTDRFSDMVVSGGVNVYPAEAEQVLARHPDVADVACIGAPDAEMGERLVALVEPVAGATPEPGDLIAHCRASLAGFKCPKEVRFVDTLSRNAMGKLDKRALRATHA
jgi:long-chain acyl-CoA synthetase